MSKSIDYILEIYTKNENGTDNFILASTDKRTNYFNLTKIMSGNSEKIVPSKSSASISSVKISIANRNDMELSKKIYSAINTDGVLFYRQRAKVFSIENQDISTKTIIFDGLITEIDIDPYETEYSLTISDWFGVLNTSLFTRELSEYSQESIANIKANKLPVGTGWDCVEVNDGNTDENGHAIKTRVIKFNGTISNFLKGMFEISMREDDIRIGNKQVSTLWKDYVDENSINHVTSVSIVKKFYIEFREPIDSCLNFLKKEVFQLISCYPYILKTGQTIKLALKLHEAPTQTEIDTAKGKYIMNSSKILKVQSKKFDFSQLVNHLMIKTKYNFIKSKFLATDYYTNASSFNKFKKLIPNTPLTFKFKGTAKYNDTERSAMTTDKSSRIFSRYSDYLIFVNIETPIELTGDLHAGKYIVLEDDFLIEWSGSRAGQRGLTSATKTSSPYMMLNQDPWGGYLSNNNIGWVKGVEIIKIVGIPNKNFFTGNTKSVQTNHVYVDNFLKGEGF